MNAGSTRPRYSIIVATLNEQGTIERCIRQIMAVYPQECEVLVVNGGNDRTGEIVEAIARTNPAVRYTPNPNDRGKGHAIRVGVSLARAPIHAQIDADLQFLPEELPRVIDPVRTGEADVVLGSRFLRGSTRGRGSTPVIRTLGNKAISAYASILFGRWLTDVQAGIKAWSAQAIQRIDLRSDNFSYEAEIAVKGLWRGLRVIDVPITTATRQAGKSNVRLLTAGGALLRDIALFRLGLK
jgi:glycosyltransferase involved in cell wall biosynthesis